MKIRYFEDNVEGAVAWRGESAVDREEMLAYAKRNDPWPFHVDEEAVRKRRLGA